MDTPMGRDASRRRADRAVTVPFGRQGTGWEVAYAALFLISNESSYVPRRRPPRRDCARLECDIRIARGIAGGDKNTHLLLTSNFFRNPIE
jgi:NAD(P)-dependent dehydrogenase (short-subunit alcohol dehydrogenase family)